MTDVTVTVGGAATVGGAEVGEAEVSGAVERAAPGRWMENDEREAWLSLIRVMAKQIGRAHV